VGNRRGLYDDPPARLTLVHDWLWRRRGTSAIVSVLLLKRLNLIERDRLADRPRRQDIDSRIASGRPARISA
jgi:hypothetical protein